MKLLQSLNYWLGKVAQRGIRLYQKTLSPDKWIPSLRLKWRVCAHMPHCSAYCKQCFERYGFWPWFLYTIDRISSCTPSRMKHYDPPYYKVVFFSSAPIGVPFLEQLSADKRYEVVWVVTAPDKPSGRWLEVKPNIIKETAQTLWVTEILTPNKINPDKSEEGKTFADQLAALDADFFVVIAYGKIMPQSVLDIPKLWPINVHGSLLPKYRGASPIQAALLHNDSMTGITIMYMDAKMDEGDEIAKLGFSIDFSWTAEDLIRKMTQIWPEFLCNSLRDFGKQHLSRKPQDHELATYCTKIAKEEWEVDPWQTNLWILCNKYRAYYLRPKIYFLHDGKRVIVEKLTIDKEAFAPDATMVSDDHSLHPSITECLVKPEGKKAMSWEEFVRGYLQS